MDCVPRNVSSDSALERDLPGSSNAPPQEEIRSPEPAGEVVRLMPKRTYQPNRLKRRKTHGFLQCAPRLPVCVSVPPRLCLVAALTAVRLSLISARRRMRTTSGRKILRRRMKKGKWRISTT